MESEFKYVVETSGGKAFTRIDRFKTWDIDENYFMFSWDFDNTHVIIRKDIVYTIKKVVK